MAVKFAVYPETNVGVIPSTSEELLLVRPISEKKFRKILKKCPSLKTITLSKSCKSRLSRKIQKIAEERDISFSLEKNSGRAISIDLQKLLQIIEMRKDFRPLREIESVTGIPKSTIHYLTKYSQRRKIKKGKETIYLK